MTASVRWAAVLTVALLLPTAASAASDVHEAHQLLSDWQLEDAFAMAKKLLAERPDDPEVWVLAARVQHHRGEHLSALALLDAASATDSGAADMLGFVEQVQSSARYADSFEKLDTEHFSIRYLNKDAIVANYAAPVLEAAYREIGGALKFLPAERGEKIVVEIYPDARGLAGATGLTISEIETSGTIAVCKFHRLMITSPLATYNGYGWADTLAHEFAHLVISKKSNNNVPIWLHEGIAKYYESGWKGDLGQALEAYSEKLLADATRKRDYVTFEQMHPSMAKLPSQEKAALAFAEVFTVIEYLTQRFGKDAIPNVLDGLADDTQLPRVLRNVFGMGLDGVERSWKKYLKKRKFREVAGASPKTIKLATNEKEAQADKGLEHIEDRQVHDWSRLGELLQMRGHNKAAVVEYEKAYAKSGAKYSTLVNRLARAYSETGQSPKALTVLRKLFDAHPEDTDAHLLAGRIRLKKKELDKARTHFEAVRLHNPFNPEIHQALASLYEAQGKTEAAEQERRFLALARKMRPTRKYDLPPPKAGTARVSIVAPEWKAVRINGLMPEVTPLWNRPIDAGEHTVEYLDAKGGSNLHAFTVVAGEGTTVVLE